MKCIRNKIIFDGFKFTYQGHELAHAPDEFIFAESISKEEMKTAKDNVIQNVMIGQVIV